MHLNSLDARGGYVNGVSVPEKYSVDICGKMVQSIWLFMAICVCVCASVGPYVFVYPFHPH